MTTQALDGTPLQFEFRRRQGSIHTLMLNKMIRQAFLLFLGCLLMSQGGWVQADETVSNEVKARNQMYADVFILKEGVDRLQIDVEVLKKRSNSQIDMLKSIQSNTESQDSNDGVCDRISGFFNSTFRKYNMFEERIITKLDEIQEEQTTNLNKILVRQNLSKNCQQGSALDIMSTALAEINEKIDKFETQLKSFETLEQKLKEQQDKFQALSDAQMNILKEINAKLSQNQVKLENFEKQMPNLKQITDNIGQISSPKKARLPMDIILGLTQNQGKPTPA